MSNEVLTTVEDGVLIITLNRPEARNAANKALAEGFVATRISESPGAFVHHYRREGESTR